MLAVDNCCLCGLLCSSSTAVGIHEISECPRRKQWPANLPTATPNSPTKSVTRLLETINGASPLIWIDAADVNTTRAIVRLAKQTGTVCHIGQSTGTEVVKRVRSSGGWLGTSLSEIASHADLVLTLGDTILTEAPRIVDRFLRSDEEHLTEPRTWLHISAHGTSEEAHSSSRNASAPVCSERSMVVSREQWYEFLTKLLLALRSGSSRGIDDSRVVELYDRIVGSQYCAILWEADQFVDSVDELLIRRLASIAQVRSQDARCSLLCFQSNPGKVTAEETLLWLTGCTSTAKWNGQTWLTPDAYSSFSLDDWSSEFESIIIVRSVASLAPLPNINASLTVDCIPSGSVALLNDASPNVGEIQVLPSGVAETAHLFRGDQAVVAMSGPAIENTSGSGREEQGLTAEKLFAAALNRLQAKSLENNRA